LLAAASPTGETGLDDDGRAAALMHLGIVELWSNRFREAESHLEQGLELARQRRRPYLEVQGLGYLAVAIGRRSFEQARERALEALAIADSHGLERDSVAGAALVTLVTVEVWQARFEDAEHWLERASSVVRPDLDPATNVLLDVARGRLYAGRGQLEDAASVFEAGARLGAQLVAPPFMTLPARRLLTQTQMRLGRTTAARAALAEMVREAPDSDMARTAIAEAHLLEGDAQAAADVLAPILDGSNASGPMLLVEAFLFDAVARDRLGDGRAAEAAVESALELAETDRLIWPFVVVPARDLLERHPHHRTAHPGLLREVLDVIAGSSPPARAGQSPRVHDDLSESELRVLRYLPSNLSSSEIARELYLSLHTVKTHTRHIYAKLGAHRRSEAIDRARELGLLSPPTRLR
jgi:LuxR family maltose regulon positive regulatory protein